MSVALCMVVKDGVTDGIQRALASARQHVDEVCIYDTGSTDGTLELLERLGSDPGPPIRVERGEWTDDFAAARAASFAMTSAEWVLRIDADEDLIGGENLREVLARAESANASAVYAAFDLGDTSRGKALYTWAPRLMRSSAGRWMGEVHELWFRDGVTEWLHGVGEPGSVYAHPSRVRVYHRDRVLHQGKYVAALENADPHRTPWALHKLGNELAGVDDERAIEAWQAYLDGDLDRNLNAWTAATLQSLAAAHERLGDYAGAAHWNAKWDRYSRRVTLSVDARYLPFLTQLHDADVVAEWTAAKSADVFLDAPPPSFRGVERNDPCPCGSGKKLKKCHGA